MIQTATTSLAEDFARRAQEWARLRVPYVHRGLTREGCDCTGLLIGILKEMGYLPRYKLRYYPKDWNLHAMADDHIQQEIGAGADPITGGSPRRGDILLFHFGKCVAHAGILTRRYGAFVHSHAGAGRCEVATLRMGKWASRHAATWRLNPEKLEAHR